MVWYVFTSLVSSDTGGLPWFSTLGAMGFAWLPATFVPWLSGGSDPGDDGFRQHSLHNLPAYAAPAATLACV